MADCENKARQGRPPFAIAALGWVAACFLILVAGLARAQPAGERWIDLGELGELHLVLPEAPSPELQLAASLFQRYWKQCTGHEVGVSTQNGGKINVWLGRALASNGLLDPSDFDDLSDEGFLIRTFTPAPRDMAVGAKKQFIIAGATDLATLYGVCDFFTRFLNVRWLAPGVVVAPRANFHFPPIDLRVDAAFPERRVCGSVLPASPEATAEFCYAHKLKFRDGEDPFAPAFRREAAAQRLHDAGRFKSHPACFALSAGQSDRVAGQLCPSAPETRSEMLSVWSEALAAEPARDTWSVSPSALAPCACGACAAAAAEAGSPMGPWLVLVNDLAEALTAAHPDRTLRFHVLAAGAYMTPPKTVRPASAVIIEISTDAVNLAVPLRDRTDSANLAFVAALRGWSRVTRQLHVRHVIAHPANPLVPLPNLVHLRDDLQVFAQVDLAGISVEVAPETALGDPVDMLLRLNLAARHLWEPDLPRQLEMPGLLRALYEAAGPAVEAYLTALGTAAATASPLTMEQSEAWWRSTAPALAASWSTALGLSLSAPASERLWRTALPVLLVDTGCRAPGTVAEYLAKAGMTDQAAQLQEALAALCAGG